MIHIILFLFSTSVFPALLPNESRLPVEFADLTKNIQTIDMPKGEKKIIEKKILEIDFLFGKISKEDIYFLSKSEIYRTFLKNPPSEVFPVDLLNENILKKMEDASAVYDGTSPFLYWLTQAIRTDLLKLFEDPYFDKFKNSVINTTGLSSKGKIFKKKFTLLLPWAELLITGDRELVTEKVKPVMIKSLNSIVLKTTQLVAFSNKDFKFPKKIEKMSFFRRGKIITNPKRKKTIEEILNPVIKKHKEEGLPLPVSDWMPKEVDKKIKKGPLFNPKPDANYKPPKELPAPTDDWILEL